MLVYISFSFHLDYFNRDQFSPSICLPRGTAHKKAGKMLNTLISEKRIGSLCSLKGEQLVFYKYHYEVMNLNIMLCFNPLQLLFFTDA